MFIATTGVDAIHGGGGDDIFIGGNDLRTDLFDGGAGDDVASFSNVIAAQNISETNLVMGFGVDGATQATAF